MEEGGLLINWGGGIDPSVNYSYIYIYMYEKIWDFLMFTAVTCNKFGFLDVYVCVCLHGYIKVWVSDKMQSRSQ